MKKHGSHAVLRLGTKLWWLRAPLTFLHATSGTEPWALFKELNALTTRPLRQPLKFETLFGHNVPPLLKPILKRHIGIHRRGK